MKLYILLGPVCSGKTTYARRMMMEHNCIRFSLDDFKTMLFQRITDDRKSEDIVEAMMESCLNILDGIDTSRDIIIDGHPLDVDQLSYLVSCYNVEIIVFSVGLFKANLRNRKRQAETGVYIHPDDIRKYDKNFKAFLANDKVKNLFERCQVKYIDNYEKRREKKLVM